MIGNAVLITTVMVLGLGIYLLQACPFLIPYRHLLFVKYGAVLAGFGGALFVNLFAAVYMACRIFFLKDTGRKLAHLEKQLRTGESLSDDLTQRLNE